MQPRSPALLWDARAAAGLIVSFVSGKALQQYESDPMLRSAVERQFQIMGDALNRLRQVDPETAGLIRDLPQIVAFRNILVHGYADVDDALVWQVATVELSLLIELLTDALPEVTE